MLLATRRMLLERAGFSIQAVVGIAALVGVIPEQLVLCHSLSEAEQTDAIRSVRSCRPDAKILILMGDAVLPRDHTYDTLPALAAPPDLIEKVRQLTA